MAELTCYLAKNMKLVLRGLEMPLNLFYDMLIIKHCNFLTSYQQLGFFRLAFVILRNSVSFFLVFCLSVLSFKSRMYAFYAL